MKSQKTFQPLVPLETDWGSRNHVRTLVLMGVTAAGLFLCFRLASPFLPALAWALALTALFTPLQRWMEFRVKNRSLAAIITVITVSLIVIVPATFVGQQLVQQATKGTALVETTLKSGDWAKALESRPGLGLLFEKFEEHVNLPEAIKGLTTWLSATTGIIVKGSVLQLAQLCFTFYLLFFFLRDRRAVLASLRSLSPLTETEMNQLLSRVDDTIYATIYGTLAVAALQGLLGGVMFWWLGLPAPLLWGVVMAALAVVPILGTFVVWLPAAVYLISIGSWEKALILALWGMLVVGTIDNLLRPILTGKRLKLHTVLAFISVVGGLIIFGAAGLILGPVILTITMVLLEIWTSRTTAETGTDFESDELARFESDGELAGPELDSAAITSPLEKKYYGR